MGVDDIVSGIQQGMDTGIGSNVEMNLAILPRLMEILNTFLGFLVVIIIVLTPIMCAIEIAYLVLPNVQWYMEKVAEASKYRGKVIGFALRDARKAMMIVASGESDASPMWIYLKLKIKTLLITGIVIALLSGAGGNIVQLMYNGVRGLLNVITEGGASILHNVQNMDLNNVPGAVNTNIAP